MNPTSTSTASVPFARALTTMVRTETKIVARDTAGLIIPLALPLLILVMNSLGIDRDLASTQEIELFTAMVIPITLALVITMIGVVNMPSFVATYRTTGVLRRLAVTPAHPGLVLAAQTIVSLLHAAGGIAIALIVAFVGFNTPLPQRPLIVVGVLALGTAALYALGMVIAAVSPSANGAIAIGIITFFAMMALGGAFGPRENLPGMLATVGEYSPFGAMVEALATAWLGGNVDPTHLMALAACAILGTAVAWRAFRWE